MISITIIIIAGVILILRQFGIIRNPLSISLIATIIVGLSVFILKNKLNCPFVKKCPFVICPLNKGK